MKGAGKNRWEVKRQRWRSGCAPGRFQALGGWPGRFCRGFAWCQMLHARRKVFVRMVRVHCVNRPVRQFSVILTEAQLRHALQGPDTGRGWPLFRRLSRSVQRDATGSEGVGGRCWSAQMACVRACACVCVMIGLDDALVTWAAVIGFHIDQFAALGGGQSPSWTCQMASHPPH